MESLSRLLRQPAFAYVIGILLNAGAQRVQIGLRDGLISPPALHL
ncbi:hypothetical protein [Methylobacterium soli]|nr:hypothetical protein [Methylobacterium soli]